MILEIIIFVMLGLLTIGMTLTYIHANSILDATNDRINHLEKDVSELDYQVEELEKKKPKEVCDVELTHYEGKEIVTTLIEDVVEIIDNGYFDERVYQYFAGDKTTFVKENGEFYVKTENIISVERKSK